MPEIPLIPQNYKCPSHGTPRSTQPTERTLNNFETQPAWHPCRAGCLIPNRFVSGLKMVCKPVPVWYSSSIHLKIGSTKRRYTEEVRYQRRLVPWGYFEGATADFCHVPDPSRKMFVATMTLQCTYQPIIELTNQESAEKLVRSRGSSTSSSSSSSCSENETEA